MNQQRPKYIAQGFVQDAGKLMRDFLKLNSLKFSDFASVWRDHHFSLIFMGRPDDVETTEFINEMFRLTTQYLFEDSIYLQAGGVYILYALYRNQISKPPVKIRLEIEHFKVITSLRDVAIKEEYKTLSYVLNYLTDKAFHYVANQTWRGPQIAGLPSIYDIRLNKLKTEYKETFDDYTKSNNLVTLYDLHKKYVEEKNKISGFNASLRSSKHEVYAEAVKTFEKFVEADKEYERNQNYGSRLAQLKKEAFEKQSKNTSDTVAAKLDKLGKDSTKKVNIPPKPVICRKPEKKPERPRKEDKRPGRPPKYPKPPPPPPEPNSDDEELDISHLVAQQKDLFLPPVYGEFKKNKTRRDPYYQRSPKKKESYKDDSSSSE